FKPSLANPSPQSSPLRQGERQQESRGLHFRKTVTQEIWRRFLLAKLRWQPCGFGEKKNVLRIPSSQNFSPTRISLLPIVPLLWIFSMAFYAISRCSISGSLACALRASRATSATSCDSACIRFSYSKRLSTPRYTKRLPYPPRSSDRSSMPSFAPRQGSTASCLQRLARSRCSFERRIRDFLSSVGTNTLAPSTQRSCANGTIGPRRFMAGLTY